MADEILKQNIGENWHGYKPSYIDLGSRENYAYLIDKPDFKSQSSRGDLDHTKGLIKLVVAENYKSVERLAKHLQAQTIDQTAFNVWHWIRKNIRYQFDTEGLEEIRTPQRAFAENRGDCDCFTVFMSCLFKCMGLDSEAHIVQFVTKDEPSHIYSFVDGVVCDPVL